MNLIDEEDNLSVAVDNFLHDGLKPFLKLSLIFRTGDYGAQVKGVDDSVLQVFRDITVHNFLRDAFRNCGLTYTRLTHKNRVILCPSAQYLKDPSYFLVSPDDRVKLALSCPLIEVNGEFL